MRAERERQQRGVMASTITGMSWTPILSYILVEAVGFTFALGVLASFTHEQPPKAAAAEARLDVSTAGRLKDDSAKAEVQDAAVRCHANLTWLLSETLHILRLDAWIPANNKVCGSRMQYACPSRYLPWYAVKPCEVRQNISVRAMFHTQTDISMMAHHS